MEALFIDASLTTVGAFFNIVGAKNKP
jgi:hypothetical protein